MHVPYPSAWARPEVTLPLIILAAVHGGMQARQIDPKHLYYSPLLAPAAGFAAQSSSSAAPRQS